MTHIKSVCKWFLLVGGMIFWFFVLVGLITDDSVTVYDCSIAEISPDYPREVVDQCRKIKNVRTITT